MAHYSEMDFLFNNKVNNATITNQLNNTSDKNIFNVFKGGLYSNSYIVYKSKNTVGTSDIKNFIKKKVYNNDDNVAKNPYVKLLNDFKTTQGNEGAGLKLRAADFVYLRDLGVYPINRMAILRRFPEGSFVFENLEEMKLEPISTVIGWIKPDQNFGKIDFNETWSTTNKRFDVLLAEIIQRNFGIPISSAVPIPDFAQGILFQFYKNANLLQRSGIDEDYEYYDSTKVSNAAGIETKGASDWGLSSIPVGDPNVLQEGPFRDPEGQNIKSSFQFELETTYEQKLLGEVDPGSAMLDILDNLYAMGTSNMVFYWGDASPAVQKAMTAATSSANSLTSWWVFVSTIMKDFWSAIVDMFTEIVDKTKEIVSDLIPKDGEKSDTSSLNSTIKVLLESILTSTIAIHRFHLRGSIELMVGGKVGSTPWHLSLGNPYSPWLTTNHIIVKSASVETSPEMGFNDQPQWLKAKFTCEFSRALGKQELMRMFNNSYRRTYSRPQQNTEGVFGGQPNEMVPKNGRITPIISNDIKTPGNKQLIPMKTQNNNNQLYSVGAGPSVSDDDYVDTSEYFTPEQTARIMSAKQNASENNLLSSKSGGRIRF